MKSDSSWRRLELGLVAITAVVFLLIPKPPEAGLPIAVFIVACIGGWSSYLAWRVTRDPALIGQWGLSPTRELRPVLQVIGPVVAVGVVASGAIAVALSRPLWVPWLWLSLLLYPIWGLVQQWLVQALVVDNVRALTGLSTPWLMALGAVGFGAIHVEHPWLVLATAALGGLYVLLFQRWRNLWPLAVAHGWLGSVFYPWVLGINPIEEIIGLLPTQ